MANSKISHQTFLKISTLEKKCKYEIVKKFTLHFDLQCKKSRFMQFIVYVCISNALQLNFAN